MKGRKERKKKKGRKRKKEKAIKRGRKTDPSKMKNEEKDMSIIIVNDGKGMRGKHN